jgi:GH24 family phage-related lysozyme (muramidase)
MSLRDEVKLLIKVPYTPAMLDALTSFAGSLSVGVLGRSALLRLLNQNQYGLAADQFLSWVYTDGRKNPDLVQQREAEEKLFRSQGIFNESQI